MATPRPKRLNVRSISARMKSRLRDAVRISAIEVQRQTKVLLNARKSVRGGRSPSPPGFPPANLTGALSRSIKVDLSEIDSLTAKVYTDLVYARIHEYGGTIVPKRRKALAIPLGNVTGEPKDYQDLFMVHRPGQPPLLVRQMYKTKWAIQPMFVLLPQVTLPPRPYLRPALSMTMPAIRDRIRRAITGSLKGY